MTMTVTVLMILLVLLVLSHCSRPEMMTFDLIIDPVPNSLIVVIVVMTDDLLVIVIIVIGITTGNVKLLLTDSLDDRLSPSPPIDCGKIFRAGDGGQ